MKFAVQIALALKRLWIMQIGVRGYEKAGHVAQIEMYREASC